MLEILFEDDHYIAINKPAGLLVHRTKIAKNDDATYAMQLLRDQIGKWVYPLHRIDRPTSGILLFAKSSEDASLFTTLFTEHKIEKLYLATVRGYLKEDQFVSDYPLKKDLIGDLQEARTSFWSLAKIELPYASSPKFATSRYSLVKAFPQTGRMHQIRRHLAHERNYLIGDTTHGENKQNKFFREKFSLQNILLHAWQVKFIHPISHEEVNIQAPLPDHFLNIIHKLGWKDTASKLNIV
ncbi:pseudouridine synthase [Anditalea andensis]|nr:pseudouridine synthase [Anditalea andensis]